MTKRRKKYQEKEEIRHPDSPEGLVVAAANNRAFAERALTCANCGQKLHVLEVHVCEHCCAELMSDPNSSMYEEEDDE